jgi:hypothetical protein
MIEKYAPFIELQMQTFYSRLPEKEQRHYAALEAQKFGYGGKSYIMGLFKLHHKTLNKGIAELTTPELYATLPVHKQRRSGGGRKKNRTKESDPTRAITRLDRPA